MRAFTTQGAPVRAPARRPPKALAVASLLQRIATAVPALWTVGPPDPDGRAASAVQGTRVPQTFTERQAYGVLELAALHASDRAQALRGCPRAGRRGDSQ
jgi:hypothetical protein